MGTVGIVGSEGTVVVASEITQYRYIYLIVCNQSRPLISPKHLGTCLSSLGRIVRRVE